MMSFKLIASVAITLCVASYAYAQLAPGSNTYLPPTTNGYSYPEPNKPFNPKPRPPTGPGPKQPPTRPGPGPQQPGDDHVHVPGMPYDFEYSVNDVATANDYSHKASSDGDVVNGEYRVALPDGRTQIVRYTADWKTGFHADVSYEGEPSYAQGPGGKVGGGYKY